MNNDKGMRLNRRVLPAEGRFSAEGAEGMPNLMKSQDEGGPRRLRKWQTVGSQVVTPGTEGSCCKAKRKWWPV